MDLIKLIIREEVNKLISEESKKAHKLRGVQAKRKRNEDEERHITNIMNKLKEKFPNMPEKEIAYKAQKIYDKEQAGRNKKYRLKKTGGGIKLVSKIDYDSKNVKSSAADAEQITSRVDQENTDIAAVARKVFPYHTDEGAQSQLRKILNGERPMSQRVAKILSDMISSGQIAVKKD